MLISADGSTNELQNNWGILWPVGKSRVIKLSN